MTLNKITSPLRDYHFNQSFCPQTPRCGKQGSGKCILLTHLITLLVTAATLNSVTSD
jgi:hypothetical protein